MMHLCQTMTLVSGAAASPLPSEPWVSVHVKETEVVALAGKDVEQSDCCLDTSGPWRRSSPPPARTSGGWWPRLVDIQVSEERHLAPPAAGRTPRRRWSSRWRPPRPGAPPRARRAPRAPARRSRRRWAVGTEATSRVRRCSHAPQRLVRRQRTAGRSAHWTAASAAGRPHPGLLYQHRQPPVC